MIRFDWHKYRLENKRNNRLPMKGYYHRAQLYGS